MTATYSRKMENHNDCPPTIDLANFSERKQEITQQLMDAATTKGAAYNTLPDIVQQLT